MKKQIGKLSKEIINILKLDYQEMPIILGDSNIEHIKNKHYEDYIRYGKEIKEIINNPTYVAKNPNQGSIEYIKKYKANNDLVLVAVRMGGSNVMFVKTMFIMSERKKNIYLRKGYAKKIGNHLEKLNNVW